MFVLCRFLLCLYLVHITLAQNARNGAELLVKFDDVDRLLLFIRKVVTFLRNLVVNEAVLIEV